jgi:serine protease Do
MRAIEVLLAAALGLTAAAAVAPSAGAQAPPGTKSGAARAPAASADTTWAAEARRWNAFAAGLAERVTPATVQVLAKGYAPATQADDGLLVRRAGSGSGVIVSGDGYVMTNAHVVAGARLVQIQFSAARRPNSTSILRTRGKVTGAQVVGTDEETDLALLKFDPAAIGLDASKIPALQLGDSEQLSPGQWVFAFGSPFGLESTITMGIVSSVARQVEPDAPMVYIQTDAAINPGNSGGPLVDLEGRVVGLNTFILSRSGGSEGLGFAIPSNIVRAVYEQLKASGRVRRGSLGLGTQTITATLAGALRLGRDWGVVVADVLPHGPGAEAGVRAGDIVLTLDGKMMENARQLDVNVYRHRIGDSVRLGILRGNDTIELTARVAERTDDSTRFLGLVSPDRNVVPRLGILALDIDPKVAAMIPPLRMPGGVLIAAANTASSRGDEVFQPGDVVHAVNGAAIKDLASLRAVVDKLKPGEAAAFHVERRGELVYVAFEVE